MNSATAPAHFGVLVRPNLPANIDGLAVIEHDGRQRFAGIVGDRLARRAEFLQGVDLAFAAPESSPQLTRIVVAVDPPVTSGEKADECGMIVAGLAADRRDDVLADLSRQGVPYRAVRDSRGKFTRAEPVAALYEQGRVRHCGVFARLEDQMCLMTPDFDSARAGYSPDRVDALVWAVSALLFEQGQGDGVFEFYRTMATKADSGF